uniref:Reverse transcriptase domain-containing protein n=1 Tax=Melanaphis sacchari TaxID=742174 RepID=A0A2H8TIE5_9HEMI
MPKYLQINLNCCKAAQALMHQVAAEENVDFVFASEFHREEGPNWKADTSGKAAIIMNTNKRLDKEGRGEAGFRWVAVNGLRLFSCYWSPNSTIQEFKDFVSRLERAIRSEATEVLLTGDFNAKHNGWGCPRNDQRGDILMDMVDSTGMVICNKGKECTFHKGSIIDLTIATPRTAQTIQRWEVLDRESLSDHFYILFQTNTGPASDEPRRGHKIDARKLETLLKSAHLAETLRSCSDANKCAQTLTEHISKCRTTGTRGMKTRKSVHWWSPEIDALRNTANHLRRVFQRKRKKHGPAESKTEETNSKAAKRALANAIKRAKETSWRNLCDLVQRDTWGLPYKLVMDKLVRPAPIPELDTPGRLRLIVDGLFPQHPMRRKVDWPLDLSHDQNWMINEAELKIAASSLKSKIAPGPDGLTNEVVKTIASLNPGVLTLAYNTCLASGVFPKIWKNARLVLIRKGDKPLDAPSSYRPLCLLDCLGKLLEKVLDNRLRRFLDDNDGLHSRQFGFRKGHSTIDALNTLKATIAPNQKVGILTLDIKNAFNSAPWAAISDALREKDVPVYLRHIIDSYLEDRTLIIEEGESRIKIDVTCGVPQGSVIGPTLWNVLYDGLLRTRLPTGVEYLAFADDVALVARAADSIELERLLATSAQIVNDWLVEIGLALAEDKCELTILTKTRTHNDISVTINGHTVNSKKCIKYLGVHIDSGWRFTEHARTVAEKADKVVRRLSRIMPNISAAKPTKRKLLSNVAHSILLYGSPTWAEDMSATGWAVLHKVQRRICLRVASAYCTTSTDAVRVITGIAPLDLLAKERKTMHESRRHPERRTPDENIVDTWQRRWTNSEKGRWTYTLIPSIATWISRRHGETNFHLTQVLTGHGCFAADLKRFGKLESAECWFCGDPEDDAAHTIFYCDAWYTRRRQVEMTVGVDLNPENLIPVMIASKENWGLIADLIQDIMRKKESEERRRQAIN